MAFCSCIDGAMVVVVDVVVVLIPVFGIVKFGKSTAYGVGAKISPLNIPLEAQISLVGLLKLFGGGGVVNIGIINN